jgi:hypothetical protein
LNAIVVEARVIAAENIDGISYCLDRAEIALILCFEKQISGGTLICVALV